MRKFNPRLLILIGFAALLGATVVFGPHVIAPLHERLVSPDDITRNLAYHRFDRLSQEKKIELIPTLLEHLSDEDWQVRLYSLYTIRIIGEPTPLVLQALENTLFDEDGNVRYEATILAMRFGKKGIPLLIRAVDRSDPSMQHVLLQSLRRMDKMAIPLLIEGLNSTEWGTQIACTRALRKFGIHAKEARYPLELKLLDKNPTVQLHAGLALNAIDPKIIKPLKIYLSYLRDAPWDGLTLDVIRAIGAMEKRAQSSIPFLSQHLHKAPDGYLKKSYPKPLLATVLEQIKPRGTEPLNLVWDAKHKNPAIRYRAITHIGFMDPPSLGMAEILVKALKDKDPTIAARALYALNRLDYAELDRFYEKMITRLLHQVPKFKKSSLLEGSEILISTAVVRLGSRIIPPVMKALQKQKIDILTADELLSLLSSNSDKRIRIYLQDSSPQVARAAALSLGRHGVKSDKILSILKTTLQDKNPKLRARAIEALEEIAGTDETN